LLDGFTGLFGNSERSLALIFGGVVGAFVAFGCGDGVGRSSIGRAGAGWVFRPVPARGPGDPTPFGPGLGAVPRAFDTAVTAVALGLGTPERGAGATDARAAGAGDALGSALARRATGAALGATLATGAGVAVNLGAAVGAGGLGRSAVATAVGAGEGAVLGAALTATATGATVGTLTGAAGTSVRGWTS